MLQVIDNLILHRYDAWGSYSLALIIFYECVSNMVCYTLLKTLSWSTVMIIASGDIAQVLLSQLAFTYHVVIVSRSESSCQHKAFISLNINAQFSSVTHASWVLYLGKNINFTLRWFNGC